MRTIAVINQKGGCGKTTVCINLASALANRGNKTLLVDMGISHNGIVSAGLVFGPCSTEAFAVNVSLSAGGFSIGFRICSVDYGSNCF